MIAPQQPPRLPPNRQRERARDSGTVVKSAAPARSETKAKTGSSTSVPWWKLRRNRKKSGGNFFFPSRSAKYHLFFTRNRFFVITRKYHSLLNSYALSCWVKRKIILGNVFLSRPRIYAGFEYVNPTHKSLDFFSRELSWCVCFSNGRFKELLNKISWNSRKSKMISQDPRLSGWFREMEILWGPLSRFLCLFLRIWLWRRQT